MPGPPIGVGDRTADKYIVESVIVEGGMGLVVAHVNKRPATALSSGGRFLLGR